jgi:hypothetical protein
MITVGSIITAKVKKCQCTGGGEAEIVVTVLKIITSANGQNWYYTSQGSTVSESQIVKVH